MKHRRRTKSRGRRESLEELYFGGAGGSCGSSLDTKALRMCRQVEQRLSLTLPSLDDPVLQQLWVRSVLPMDGGTLLVEVVCPAGAVSESVLERLNAARGLLRSDVAHAIHRKRTPHLQFMVVGQSSADTEAP